MTLHPWPLNDIGHAGTPDHRSVLWTGQRGRGLLSDSLAVPLCFMPEVANPEPVVLMATAVEPVAAKVFHSSALLRLRDIGCRFGTGA